MFIPDEEVDSFMQSYDETAKDKDCNNFQAGNNLRSKSKTSKLSVTGIFGTSCRHEFPQKFLNMRHGERLGYPVMILNKILDESRGKSLQVHIIYDIACVLRRHLEKKGTLEKYAGFKFGVPVFHSYGHNGTCQVKNSIRRLDGFGLMDGELMERLWSYLRPFSKVTKEMTPAHRTDLLCDALYHFGAIKMENIGSHLCFLRRKANEALNTCTSELESLSAELSVTLDDDTLSAWKVEEESPIQGSKAQSPEDWKRNYFNSLREWRKEKSLARYSPDIIDVNKHAKKANTLDGKLRAMEKKHGIERWTESSKIYISENEIFLRSKMADVLQQTYNQANERAYLLNLKAKYADGSAIATRLSKQINKACRNIQNSIMSYNTYGKESHVNHVDVSYRIAYDCSSDIYKDVIGINVRSTPGVSAAAKRKAVALFCRCRRALEEISLVNQDMANTLTYWSQECQTLLCCIDETEGGVLFHLNNVLKRTQQHLSNLKQLFASTFDGNVSEPEYDSDSETDV